jgi:hypothetical protein
MPIDLLKPAMAALAQRTAAGDAAAPSEEQLAAAPEQVKAVSGAEPGAALESGDAHQPGTGALESGESHQLGTGAPERSAVP